MKHIKFDDGLEQITVFDDRFYTKNGKDFFPSVTTILDVYPKVFIKRLKFIPIFK